MRSLSLLLLYTITIAIHQGFCTEIVVQNYKGLGRTEISRYSNQRYGFTFCSCNSKAIDPSSSSDCSCSNEAMGKTAMESTYKAVYSAACVHTMGTKKCLNVDIPGNNGAHFYVKITLGGSTISNPDWQELTAAKYKTSETITTNYNTNIILTYLIVRSGKTTQPQTTVPWITRKPSSKYIEKIKPTKTHPVNPVAIPTLFTNGRVQQLNDINQIRYFLLREGIKQGALPQQLNIPEFKRRVLSSHNSYRARHGVSSLSYDSNLESFAQRWADTLGNREDCLVHENPKNFGENLFWFAAKKFVDTDLFAEVVTQAFYMEGHGYSYRSFGSYHTFGHFTQLVWKSTQRMGVGIAIRNFSGRRKRSCNPSSPIPMVYVVVKYDPPGNVQSYNSYMQNVLPPIFKQ